MIRSSLTFYLVFLLAFTCVAETAASKLKLAHIFQDNMVLQCDAKVPVWGWADAGEKVTVNFAGQTKTATAGKDGYWRVNLEPLKVSEEGRTLTASCGGNKIECKDILVGEVWFCAGQSNMAWKMGKHLRIYPKLTARLGSREYPDIRYIRYEACPLDTPLKDMDPLAQKFCKWAPISADTIDNSQALPFYFGRKLLKELNVPIGLIQVAVGGTPQTAWCSRKVIDKVAAETGSDKDYEYFWKEREVKIGKQRNWPCKSWRQYTQMLEEWRKTRKGVCPDYGKMFPCVLYNTMVLPLAPYAFRGVIWYQGGDGPFWQYAERMVAMAADWRKLFERDFVFIFGGMARDTKEPPPLAPILWLNYRQNRNRAFFLPAQEKFGYGGNSVLCDLFDLGNHNSHYGEKDKAGDRFALTALTVAYGQNHVFTGPQLIKTEVKPGEITLKFAHAGSGLVYKPSIDGISGFILESGKDYMWIGPTSVGKDTLVFKHDKILKDSKIYYSFHHNPHETLFNKEGFHASVFPKEKYVVTPLQKDEIQLVKVLSKPNKKAYLNLTHFRRNVFVFDIDSWEDKDREMNRVRIRIPKEWKTIAVRRGEKFVAVGEIKTDEKGRRTFEMDVQTNAGPYIFFNKDKEEQAMKELDLSRF